MSTSTKKSKILLMTTWMPAAGRRSMYHDLADEFVRQGHRLDVIAIDWRKMDQVPRSERKDAPAGYRLFRFQPLEFAGLGALGLGVKWIGTSLLCLPRLFRLLISNKYDVVVAQTPAAFWAMIMLVRLLSRAKLYLIKWDFTPYHQRAIGMMRDGVAFNFLLFLENISLRRFDVIGCMSPMNVEYLRKHYRVKSSQKLEVLPIWATLGLPPEVDRNEIRIRHGLPLGKKIAVFGGTLSAGRGIEDIVAAANFATQASSELVFVIVGGGPMEEEVRAMSSDIPNLILLKTLRRGEYMELLKASDVGIVATMRDTGVPTFPSKTLDYFRAGVPVVVSVEDSTDFGSYLEKQNAAIVVSAGNPDLLFQTIERVTRSDELSDHLAKNGKLLLESNFRLSKIADQIVN